MNRKWLNECKNDDHFSNWKFFKRLFMFKRHSRSLMKNAFQTGNQNFFYTVGWVKQIENGSPSSSGGQGVNGVICRSQVFGPPVGGKWNPNLLWTWHMPLFCVSPDHEQWHIFFFWGGHFLTSILGLLLDLFANNCHWKSNIDQENFRPNCCWNCWEGLSRKRYCRDRVEFSSRPCRDLVEML